MTLTTRQVWNVRLGPCFCGVRPGRDGSFDLHRWQIRHVGADELSVNLLVATAEVPEHVADEISMRLVPDRHNWLVMTSRVCPYARRSGAVERGVPVVSLTSVDHAIESCIADRPDHLVTALLAPKIQANETKVLAAL